MFILISVIKKIFIYGIELYKYLISPLLPSCCRFYPTCSDYALVALKTKPLFKAIILITYRILRCNPFSQGGADPII